MSADQPQTNNDQSQQTSSNVEMIKTLGTIVVTGTHIRNVDSETEHPVQVLKREDLLRTGLTGVADIVQSLIVANGQTLNRNINNGGSGELRDLRSLGANRTLVLVNGQRWASAVDGAVTYVDLEASWSASWKGTFTLGVRNAFDRNPPAAYSAFANSFFPDHDVPAVSGGRATGRRSDA